MMDESRENAIDWMSAFSEPRRTSLTFWKESVVQTRTRVPFALAVARKRPSRENWTQRISFSWQMFVTYVEAMLAA